MRRTALAPSPIFVVLLAATVVGGFLATSSSPDPRTAGIVILVLGGWAVSLCLHEFGHAITAYRGGDRSVRAKGYLTLDIRRYTDPVLSMLLPLLLLLIGGIPLPGGAVWIDRHRLRSRVVESMVSAAGPLMNLALAVGLIVAVDRTEPGFWLAAGLSYLAFIQVLAFLINVLPIPGLDGFGVLEPHLQPQTRRFADKVRPFAPLVLFALIIGIPAVGDVLWDATETIFEALGGDEFAANVGEDEFLFWD